MTTPIAHPTPIADPGAAHIVDSSFPHHWRAEIFAARPAILPARRFVYPRDAEEVERGALEVLVRPGAAGAEPFLATCALGFHDPAVPSGIWSCPNPEEICAVAGGYAYLIDTTAPERFTMIAFRPVIEIRSAPADALVLFAGHHAIIGWGRAGKAWESEKLSDEGVTITKIESGILHGYGWDMKTDREAAFAIDLRTGLQVLGQA
jgi:hypothetical protein